MKFAQGRFEMKNPEKYVGKKIPLARSSWYCKEQDYSAPRHFREFKEAPISGMQS
jgi:hypothetical protein